MSGHRIAFFYCFGGASGDMLLGALLDAGLPLERLRGELAGLPVGGFRLEARRERRGGLVGTRALVHLGGDTPFPWEGLLRAVEGSALPEGDRALAKRVLEALRWAEVQAHREPSPPQGELTSLDTLVDVVGVVAGLRLLGVGAIYASPLPAGAGLVVGGHGPLPAPAPATMALLARAKAPLLPPPAPDAGETVTPTAAALLTTLARFGHPPMRVEAVGYGLGRRDHPAYPNALALWLGRPLEEAGEGLVLLETNLDDTTPQVLGYVQERLLALGARDAWFTPAQMKKNRPGVLLSALVPRALEAEAVRLFLRETTTLGVRARPVQRYEAERRLVEVETSLGRVPVKVKVWEGEVLGVAPEYEACRQLARERGLPLQTVMERVREEASRLLTQGPLP